MKRLAFAFGILALGFAATTPARADYAVVQWQDGYCHIWWDSGATPWGAGWAKIAVEPDWETAWAALNEAVLNHTCR
jgi:hypothetical protein